MTDGDKIHGIPVKMVKRLEPPVDGPIFVRDPTDEEKADMIEWADRMMDKLEREFVDAMANGKPIRMSPQDPDRW